MTGNPEATRPNATGDIASMVDDGVPVPRVFNKHHGDAPPDAVYIGRGSPWGNPFVMGIEGARDKVCDRFEAEILPTLDVSSLRGKNLVCFCAPLRCHGDAILKKANI